MDDMCRTCTIRCRQADHIHETALGRMYALNELLSYVKKVDSGELVEVVRCKDCKHWHEKTGWCNQHSHFIDANSEACHPWESADWKMLNENDFCSYGERKTNETD